MGHGGCLLDGLRSACVATLDRLLRDCWGVAAPINLDKLMSTVMSLEQCSPPAFVQTGSGNRAVRALTALNASELESVLQGPSCSPEFRVLLQPGAGAENEIFAP